MSEPKDPPGKVESLEERRQMKLLEQHREGDAFAFEHYKFNPDGVGTDKIGVTVLLNDELEGVFMSPEDAEALGVALIQAAAIAKMEKDGVIEYVDSDQGPEVG